VQRVKLSHHDLAHLHAHLGTPWAVAALQERSANAGIGRDEHFGPLHHSRVCERQGEATQPVAADLGTAPIRVVQLHADLTARHSRTHHQEPVGPDPAVASADRTYELGHLS
jgi:hypothetical protein